MTGATLFSGFGGADLGMQAAGVEVLWGIELEDDIASVARQNGLNIRTGDITKANLADFPVVDALHASPVCKSFSVAKAGREELEIDRNAAEATVRFIRHIEPEIFTLENVWGYRDSESWNIIYKALMRLGYGVGHAKLVAADYGVPQTRERMIVWATQGGYVPAPPAPTHMKNPPSELDLFGLEYPKWVGWLEAIKDLIPSLPDSKLADWQMDRLPDELRTLLVHPTDMRTVPMLDPERPSFTIMAGAENINIPRAVLVGQNANDTSGAAIETEADRPAGTVRTGTNHVPKAVLMDSKNAGAQWGDGMRDAHAPSATVVTDHKPSHAPRAVLVDGLLNDNSASLTTRRGDDPSMTVTTSHNQRDRKAIVGVRVVQMTPRCLARFQSFPDSYELPESRALACTGIGNAVPPLLQQRLYEHLLSFRKR